ncbi:substrate-binding periplasmic protein [Marinobacterium arenosum]|uniref:substrate-binding periplasmic protein n=1 Tax=Marinobacterium arenosum TaxID=2862496 RepID=UPI001C96903F|nr:transporter substrate-binding domain-containing protein [Marinobacterium arenosum]MBY4677077.1 transporter substrate-binding domain-containing protein [Marinobacterium arenosum]
MKNKTINNGLLALAAGWVLTLSAPAAQAVERLKLATQHWPPYQTLEEGRMGGVAVERVQCALRRMGQPYELHMMRWDKAQLLVETNQMHGFFAGSANSVRARYAEPSIPVVTLALTWFVAPGVTLDLADESAKYQARYSAKFNTSKWLFLKKNGYNVVKKPRDADALLQMLWQGDVDVALEYEQVFEYSMKKLGIPTDYFRRVADRRRDQNVHFSKEFLKQNPNFLGAFNQALERCIKS